jgi:hypothetical protein
MFRIDSRETLRFAREHARRLHGDVLSNRAQRASWKRRSLVPWFRRHACRCHIDPAPLAHRAA